MSAYAEVPAWKLCALCLGVMDGEGTCGCEAYERATVAPAPPAPVIRIEAARAMRERAELQQELARHQATQARLSFAPSEFLRTRLAEIAARMQELDAVICGRRAS